MGLGSWLQGSRTVDGASSRPDAWGKGGKRAARDIYATTTRNEIVDLSAAFDKDDMAADLLLEIRPERTPADLLPLAPARPVTEPVRLLLHSALFDTRSGYKSDLADRLYRNHFKPQATAADALELGIDGGCSCWAYSLLPSKEAPAGPETLAPHQRQLPAVSSLRLPAAPYQHLVWTVEPGEVEAAVQLLKWCYTKQLSPEALSSPQLLCAVYDLSAKYKAYGEYGCSAACVKAACSPAPYGPDLSAADIHIRRAHCRPRCCPDNDFQYYDLCWKPQHFGSGLRDRDVIVELRALPPTGGQRSSKGSGRAASLSMHAVVMMTGSPYFKARLSAASASDGRWAPEPAATAADGLLARLRACTHRWLGGKQCRGYVLVEHVEDEELELAQAVLCSLYGWQSLPAAITKSPLTLLRTLLLAGRFQVARCTALCLAALAMLPLEAWDADAVAQLLELPEEVMASATSPGRSLADLQARARKVIAERYGNLSAIEKAGPDGTLYLQFMGLPLSAVSAILSSPAGDESNFALQRRSCLALAWLEGQQGRRCSPEQRSMLKRTTS